METPGSFRSRFEGMRLLWQAYYSSYCLGLCEAVPVHTVLAMDEGLDTDEISRSEGIEFLTCQRAGKMRGSFADRALEDLALRYEAGLAERLDGAGWMAWSPGPVEALARVCAKAGVPCHAVPWSQYEWFGSKAHLREALARLGLPRLPGRCVESGSARYGELAREFGARFVMQMERGADGSGTAIVGASGQFSEAARRFAGAPVWVGPYAGPLSLNVNAVATSAGVAVAYPSVQLVGHAVLRSSRAGHCGNDFTATAGLPRSIPESIRRQTVVIGQWMAGLGYRGLFGLDFVVDEQTAEAFIVDLNPRMQGSTSLEAQASQRAGRIPLVAAEAARQAGVLDEAELRGMADSFFEPIEGAQCFLKAPPGGRWGVAREMPPGVYREDLALKRPALRLAELRAPDEVLLNGHNPRPGDVLGGSVRLLRICSLRRMQNGSTGNLEDWVIRLAARADEALGLAPVPA